MMVDFGADMLNPRSSDHGLTLDGKDFSHFRNVGYGSWLHMQVGLRVYGSEEVN